LTLIARQVEDGVVIEIGDRGPGIEAQHLDSVFDRFWRAKRSKRAIQGAADWAYPSRV